MSSLLGVFSVAMSMHGALEFADDHRPKVTYQKHISYQKKLQRAGKMKSLPNKLLNYNVMVDVKEVKGIIKNAQGNEFLIVEPRGYEGKEPAYYARMACDKNFKNCISLTNNYNN